jgi:hypothetical protein
MLPIKVLLRCYVCFGDGGVHDDSGCHDQLVIASCSRCIVTSLIDDVETSGAIRRLDLRVGGGIWCLCEQWWCRPRLFHANVMYKYGGIWCLWEQWWCRPRLFHANDMYKYGGIWCLWEQWWCRPRLFHANDMYKYGGIWCLWEQWWCRGLLLRPSHAMQTSE